MRKEWKWCTKIKSNLKEGSNEGTKEQNIYKIYREKKEQNGRNKFFPVVIIMNVN